MACFTCLNQSMISYDYKYMVPKPSVRILKMYAYCPGVKILRIITHLGSLLTPPHKPLMMTVWCAVVRRRELVARQSVRLISKLLIVVCQNPRCLTFSIDTTKDTSFIIKEKRDNHNMSLLPYLWPLPYECSP
jgi:hypothetical protein